MAKHSADKGLRSVHGTPRNGRASPLRRRVMRTVLVALAPPLGEPMTLLINVISITVDDREHERSSPCIRLERHEGGRPARAPTRPTSRAAGGRYETST
jgi:hypothetical protein